MIVAAPLFVVSFGLTQVDFTILWRYFSWANQTTAVVALWVGAMYLLIAKRIFGGCNSGSLYDLEYFYLYFKSEDRFRSGS